MALPHHVVGHILSNFFRSSHILFVKFTYFLGFIRFISQILVGKILVGHIPYPMNFPLGIYIYHH